MASCDCDAERRELVELIAVLQALVYRLTGGVVCPYCYGLQRSEACPSCSGIEGARWASDAT
jgi:hypothetical protein